MDNSPTQTPSTPTIPPTQTPTANPVHSSRLPLLLMLLAAALLFLGGTYYLNQRSQLQTNTIPQPTVSQPVNVVPSVDETENWKTYTNDQLRLTLKYPLGWTVKGGYDQYYQGQVITINNPSMSVAINLYPRQPVYGLEGQEQQPAKTNTISLTIDHQTYTSKETILNNNRAYVDFQLNGSSIHVLFGTGYPAGEDKLASLAEYNKSRDIILKILSTFTFLAQQQSDTKYWKKFANTKAGITLRYPSDWFYEDDSSAGGAEQGTSYGFYKVGTKAMPSSSDDPGNETMVFTWSTGTFTINDLKKNYPSSHEVVIIGRPALQSDNMVKIIGKNRLVHLGIPSKENKSIFEKIITTVTLSD